MMIEAIPDADARLVEQAAAAVDEARRELAGGEDGLEPLVRMRPRLGRLSLPALGFAVRRQRLRRRLLGGVVIAIAPACMIATSAFGWTFPFGSGVRVRGEGLAGASGGARSTAIDLIEKGAQAATLISGPLDDDQIVEAITRGGPVESVCMAEGLHSTAVRATTIRCVYILIGDYVGDHQDRAILSAGPPPDPSSDPIAAAFGVPSKPAYLVSIPAGTVRTLLSLIRPNPYPGDGFALYFPTGGGTLSGEDLAASVWPRIDVALPAAILVSGPLSSTEVDALIDNEAPGLEWIPGGRPTMLPVPAPGQRVYAVLVLGGSTDGDAVVTFDRKGGPRYLYRLDPSLGGLVREAFTPVASSPP